MRERTYKKMAGTSAVFVLANFESASPVERDGLTWSDSELGMPSTHQILQWKGTMDSSLALEGLEEYEPPTSGDARFVSKLGIAFVYVEKAKAWVALTDFI
jgi:hypothetical protein